MANSESIKRQDYRMKTTSALKGMPAHMEDAEQVKFGSDPIDYLMLNVPPACNYACEKCFTWANSEKITDYLSTEEVLRLVDEGHGLGAKTLCIIGEGEPLLYLDRLRRKVDYRSVVERANTLGVVSLIATNGSLLDDATLRFCYGNNVTLVVSLDTLDADEYATTYRGAADLALVLRNLDSARQLYSQDIYVRNGVKVHRLGVHMTVTAKNRHRISDVRTFCADDIYFDCDHVAPVGMALESNGVIGPHDSHELELCVRASRNDGPPMVETLARECNRRACSLFYYGLSIGFEGEVMIDTHAVETKHFVGNVRGARLEDLLAQAKLYRDIYFRDFGEHACIIRNPRYKEYLNAIRSLTRSTAPQHLGDGSGDER